MKDLVPKGTGNSRFLRSSIPSNITHEELVALLRAGTFPVDFAGLNSAGVAVVGSAYNKANVLPDDVCTRLGLSTTDSEPKDAFLAAATAGWREYERITTSKNWIVPEGIYRIGVFLLGAGQGGFAGNVQSDGDHYYGGASGFVNNAILDVTPGESIKIVIGAKGIGGHESWSSYSKPTNGGDTMVNGIIARGGGYPRFEENSNRTYLNGFTVSSAPNKDSHSGLYMYITGNYHTLRFEETGNIFDPSMLIGSAGASVGDTTKGAIIKNTPVKCDLGIGGTAAGTSSISDVNAGHATGNGNGGGAACIGYGSDDPSKVAVAGDGSPGLVIIYV